MPLGRALIVDDSRAIRMFMSDKLKAAGFADVLEAKNAEEALKLYYDYKPEVVFLDMVMPGIPGNTLAEHILERFPEAKIVAVTSLGRESEEVTRSMAAGVRHFLRKPITDEGLAEILTALKLK
ncbi:MAG: response regulator [Euryarchaeota archaeon]|nr:response regulator [Euryarchaeota archaeon]